MNCITIELCAEDRARLDQIIDLLGGLRQPNCSACVEGIASYMDKAAAVLDSQLDAAKAAAPAPTPAPAPAPVPEAPKAAPVPAPVKPAVTLEQIQKKATQIAAGSASKKAALRALVNKYAAKVTDLPESAWAAVWDGLCALESEA